MNMNSTFTISAATGVLATKEASARSTGRTEPEKSSESTINFTRIRPSLWDAGEIVQMFAGLITAFYLIGAVALAVALLFYTFTR
jgi:hypothetical protein